jgi:hypothetical protein
MLTRQAERLRAELAGQEAALRALLHDLAALQPPPSAAAAGSAHGGRGDESETGRAAGGPPPPPVLPEAVRDMCDYLGINIFQACLPLPHPPADTPLHPPDLRKHFLRTARSLPRRTSDGPSASPGPHPGQARGSPTQTPSHPIRAGRGGHGGRGTPAGQGARGVFGVETGRAARPAGWLLRGGRAGGVGRGCSGGRQGPEVMGTARRMG